MCCSERELKVESYCLQNRNFFHNIYFYFNYLFLLLFIYYYLFIYYFYLLLLCIIIIYFLFFLLTRLMHVVMSTIFDFSKAFKSELV